MIHTKDMNRNFLIDGPLLDSMRVSFSEKVNFNNHPFSLPIIKNLESISFPSKVTFFIGENGTGKSTILEALAHKAGFGPEGGSKNISFKTSNQKTYTAAEQLSEELILSWRQKPKDGYFFRAESFFNIANHIDLLALYDATIYHSYGGKSLHEQSHGESFLSFFQNRLGKGGFFILDEPEAALSPQRQLALMAIIYKLCKSSHAQFIIATHSPLLLAYPNATIYSCDLAYISSVLYEDTEHYRMTKSFLNNPNYYLHYLFNEE
jgi:predicted ATPase